MARPRGTGRPVQLSTAQAATVADFIARYRLQSVITRYASEVQPAARMANWTPEFRATVAARSDELDAIDHLIRTAPGARRNRVAAPVAPRTARGPIARPFATRNVGPADVNWNVVQH